MNKTRRLIAGLTTALAISACTDSQEVVQKTHAKSDAISVVDFAEQRVQLEAPANRVIALAPHIVENVFTVGAGDTLVGVVAHSNFPERAKALPLVGGYAKTNLEKIVELKPDLVIAWESGNSQESINKIKELGIPVYIDQPDTLEDISRSLRDIGTLTGQDTVGNAEADEFAKKIQQLRKRYKGTAPVSAFYQVWNSPLHTINGNHIISDAIELCGGINIYADEVVVAPIINIESLVERDPAAIIASGMSSARPDWLDDWKKWSSLRAVKEDNLFFVNPDHIQRHTIRILLGIESICRQLDIARNRPTP